MKLYLASFFEPENHGPGRAIGVCPGKPRQAQIDEVCQAKHMESYTCNIMFEPLSPEQLYWDYHKEKKDSLEKAAENFITGFQNRLKSFEDDVWQEVKFSNKTVEEVLPFEEGDTLLTWEREGNTTYRKYIATTLTNLGYDVEEH